MSVFLISLCFALGIAGFLYPKLTRANGNADPKQNFIVLGVVALVIFLILFTLLKFVIHF